jgi:hypothetical protein
MPVDGVFLSRNYSKRTNHEHNRGERKCKTFLVLQNPDFDGCVTDNSISGTCTRNHANFRSGEVQEDPSFAYRNNPWVNSQSAASTAGRSTSGLVWKLT